MYNIDTFKVFNAFNELIQSKKIDINDSDVEHIKLIDDGFRISYYSAERDQLVEIAERIADELHCKYCIYEAIPIDWGNCYDGRLEFSVTEDKIPVVVEVDNYGINVYIYTE